MVKVTYLGPGASTRMKLRRAYMDLALELDRCKPLGPEYKTLTNACEALASTYLELFKEPIRQGTPRGDVAGGWAD